MADSKDEMILRLRIETDKANAALARTEVEIKKTIQSFKGLTKGSLEYQAAQAKLAGLQAKYAQQSTVVNKKMEKSLVSLNKELDGSTQASGAATTSVLELGRVVSDAPYGIRGMANNVSQLASNMLFGAQQIDKATGKAIGFTGVIKGMGKAFIGPLGILFAIQAVVAAVDFFFGGMKKAEEKSKELASEVGKTAGEFRRLNVILQDGRISLEDRTEALKKLKKEYPQAIELIKSYEDNLKTANNTIDDSIELEKAYTKVIIDEAKKRAAKKKVEEKSGEVFILQDERDEDLKSAKKHLLSKAALQDDATKNAIKNAVKIMESEFDVSKHYSLQSEEFKQASLSLNNLASSFIGGNTALKDFSLGLFKNREDIAELNKEIERLATGSVDFEEQKRKEAEALAKQRFELSVKELKQKIQINEAIISNEETTNEQKEKLIRDNFATSLAILNKEKENRNKDFTDSELDKLKRQNSNAKFNKEYIALQVKLRDDLAALEDKSEDKKISPFKTPKELEIDVKNVDKALLAYEKKTRDNRLKEELNNKLSQAKSEEERKLIKDAYAADRLESELKAEGDRLILAKETEESIVKDKYNTHIAQLNNAKELYEFKIKNDPDIKNKEGLLKKLNSTHESSLKQAKDEFDISMSEIQSNFELISVAFEDYSESRRNSLNSGDFGSEGDGEDPRMARLAKMEEFVNRYMEVSGVLTEFMNGEFNRQLTIEQNKTNSINNELRERLNNENLSADERKNIQLKIARNDEASRKRQEEIKKKQFRLNKAANIANALVDTYRGASAAYRNTMLNPANAVIPFPLVQAKAIKNAKVASIFGLANVAMIARQKFQSSISTAPSAGALGGGGGSGSGNGDRSFNFNLAGASQENQLAQTLQGRFDQPLQAYVVSRDITNQQQLDMDIQNNASFG